MLNVLKRLNSTQSRQLNLEKYANVSDITLTLKYGIKPNVIIH